MGSTTKMTLIGSPNAVLILCVDGILSLGAVITCKTIQQTILAGVLCLALIIIHLYLNHLVQERKYWGNVCNPYYVIDWGPYGKKIESKIPRHMLGHVEFVHGSDVDRRVKEVRRLIKEAKNPLFHPRDPAFPKLEVSGIWFARGEHVCQTGKQYIKMLVKIVEEEKTRYHRTIDAAPKEMGIDPEAYDRIYIQTGRNGSIDNYLP